MSSTPKLLSSSGSQHARRVRVLVHELELDIEVEEVPFGAQGFGGNEREAFLALNPNGKVPVLVHDDVVIWESNAIMAYLCEWSGSTPLWPDAPLERAQVAKWQFWQAAHLTPAADGLFAERFVKPRFTGETPDAAHEARLAAAFGRWMAVLEAQLTRSEYLALNRFTCADISVAGALMQHGPAQFPLDDFPGVSRWFQSIRSRPSWAQTEPTGRLS